MLTPINLMAAQEVRMVFVTPNIDKDQRLEASRLGDAAPGVTWDDCRILIDLARRGEGLFWRSLRLGPRAGDGKMEAAECDYVWLGCKVQILPPQPTNLVRAPAGPPLVALQKLWYNNTS